MGPSRDSQYYTQGTTAIKREPKEGRLIEAHNIRRQTQENPPGFFMNIHTSEIENQQTQIRCLSPSPEDHPRNYDGFHRDINLPLSDLSLSGDSFYQKESYYKHKRNEYSSHQTLPTYPREEYYCNPDTHYYESLQPLNSGHSYDSREPCQPLYNSVDSYNENGHYSSTNNYMIKSEVSKPVAHHHCGSIETSPYDSLESGSYSDSFSASGYDEDQPLDLTTRKQEEEEVYECDPEMQEEPNLQQTKYTWLKKIATGTRSRVRSPKSWEFLVRLLLDEVSNPSLIKWEDEISGTFRLVQKDEIARIWGTRSTKHQDVVLTYDNFARNLRYHYKTKMLVPVSEKHLVYKFSPWVMAKYFSGFNSQQL